MERAPLARVRGAALMESRNDLKLADEVTEDKRNRHSHSCHLEGLERGLALDHSQAEAAGE
jgi:hypothetical protein